jgi:hypothetical protein
MSYAKADGGFYCQGKDGQEHQISKLEGDKVVCVSPTTASTTTKTGLQAAVLPPLDLSQPQGESSNMPKPPSEESSMPKPPEGSASMPKPPKVTSNVTKPKKGRRVTKRYRPRRGPTQTYDPAATAAAINALINAIGSANRGGGGGGGGGHHRGH